MMRWLRRLVVIGVLGGGCFAGYRAWASRQSPSATSPTPSWPPLTSVETATGDAVAAAAPRWVAPVDGQCPPGYPVKANDNSGIYHEPGGRFYVRTVPERCYANADDAIADGYRPAKA
jgi:hypothetical protein